VTHRRILLLATTTGYQTRSFGDAAGRLGVEVALATDRCTALEDPWRDRALPIRFDDESGSVAEILDEAARFPFAGLLAVGDRPVAIAAQAAAALGLPYHSIEGARAAHNKRLARERLAAAGLPVPWFACHAIDSRPPGAADVPFPCVIKPLVLSGSRGVIRANTPAELHAAHARLVALLQSREVQALRDPDAGAVLIEGYIPGDEYAIEGLLEHGHLRVLSIFDKPAPLEGPFFEETIYVTPSRGNTVRQRRIEHAVALAAAALGLRHGPIHAECRVDGDRVYVLEVAARPIGGLCARALRFANGGLQIPLEELLLRHALGEPSAIWAREAAASGVMMIPIPHGGVFRRVNGLEAARAVPHVTEIHITAKADQRLVPLPEGASYLGFIFARAQDPDTVEDALRRAHARLAFIIDRALTVVSPSRLPAGG
jgi:biotin carboxylase